QIPDHIKAGHTLAPSDVALLRDMIADRDGLLQRLYAENSELRQAQDRGLSGKLIYLLKRYFVRFRK
ncbi:MAG TPA: 2OG-Fe(II) oxygenase, partial [Xanthomonadaceae bacterium]|nr:2OG-Fe(II) oxygenase [Xanthomonadaceae bacterium]